MKKKEKEKDRDEQSNGQISRHTYEEARYGIIVSNICPNEIAVTGGSERERDLTNSSLLVSRMVNNGCDYRGNYRAYIHAILANRR